MCCKPLHFNSRFKKVQKLVETRLKALSCRADDKVSNGANLTKNGGGGGSFSNLNGISRLREWEYNVNTLLIMLLYWFMLALMDWEKGDMDDSDDQQWTAKRLMAGARALNQ